MIDHFLGWLLRGRHAGDTHLLWTELAAEAGSGNGLSLTSHGFVAHGDIPRRYAGVGVGDNVSPSLAWSGVPAGTVELVLVMEDPDAPLKRPFVHLIASDIPPSRMHFAEGALRRDMDGVFAKLGKTSAGRIGYSGPRALPGHGRHRYVFQLYALNAPAGLAPVAKRGELTSALRGKVIAKARLDGYFER